MKHSLDILIFLLYIFGSGFGLLKIKSAQNLVSFDFLIGLLFYVGGFVLWMVLLRRLPLSVIFPIAAGGLVVFTQVLGHFYLNESMNISKFIGVTAISFGIAQIYLSGKV